MAGKRNCQKTKRSKQPPETSIFDTFSPINFKKIPPTSTKKDEDVFHCLRPNKGECLDYDISETVLKMEAGDVKINVKDTKATYVPAPPIVSKKKKKLETPPYKFITEMWLEEQNMLQEKYKKENRRNFKHQRTKHKLKSE